MSPAGVTDVLMQGMESTTVKAILRGRPESIVTGQFANQVEVLSAVNQSDITNAQENSEERMEIEVSDFKYFYICKKNYMLKVVQILNNEYKLMLQSQITAAGPVEEGKNIAL